MELHPRDLLPVLVSLVLALVLTPVVRALARRWRVVARPKCDRWHKKPTAMLGGVAIFAAVVVAYLVFVPPSRQSLMMVAGSSLLFVVGLVDDLLHLKPYQKLAGQLMGAAVVIFSGLSLEWTPWPLVNMGITLFWLVGITNAVNLLDNMDGLAAGVACIAAVFQAVCLVEDGRGAEAVILAMLAAALFGFLVYNSNPASIFMGDCGSMFLGFFLASSALLHGGIGGRSRWLAVLAVPVLILLIPIFDTTFVTIVRKLHGRRVSQGGRDHTSHRLVALGVSERRAVWMLYAFATMAGLLAVAVRTMAVDLSLAIILGFTVTLTLVGVHLAGVRVYGEEESQPLAEQPLGSFLVDLSYKRRIFEVLLDVVLVVLAYYFANVAVDGPLTSHRAWAQLQAAVPVLVFVKLAVFLAMGVYRGLWRYVSIDNLVTYAKAVAVSSVVALAALIVVLRLHGFSRTLFMLDALLLFCFVAGSRVTFRVLRTMIRQHDQPDGRRVLIYGAGDAGELLLRELRNNPAHAYVPVGFADDDPAKHGRVIHGLRVFPGNGKLAVICQEQRVDEVVISSVRIAPERVEAIRVDCERARVELKRMRIEIEAIAPMDSRQAHIATVNRVGA